MRRARDACAAAQECRGDALCPFLHESEACQALAERTVVGEILAQVSR